MKLNVTNLKSNTIFTSSVSRETRKAIINSGKNAAIVLDLYMEMRADFTSFVSQEQSKDSKYDNTLTCYSKTNATLAEQLGYTVGTIEKAMKTLKELGLLVSLPFTANGKERHNLIVLDYALEDYSLIMKACAERLETFIAENRRSAKAQKQLDMLTPYLNDKTAQEAPVKPTEPVKEVKPAIEPVIEKAIEPVANTVVEPVVNTANTLDTFNPFEEEEKLTSVQKMLMGIVDVEVETNTPEYEHSVNPFADDFPF